MFSVGLPCSLPVVFVHGVVTLVSQGGTMWTLSPPPYHCILHHLRCSSLSAKAVQTHFGSSYVPTEQSKRVKKSHDVVGSKPSSERGTIKKLTSAMEENVVKSVLAIGAGERDELKKRLA